MKRRLKHPYKIALRERSGYPLRAKDPRLDFDGALGWKESEVERRGEEVV
jgi:hypothetical protein